MVCCVLGFLIFFTSCRRREKRSLLRSISEFSRCCKVVKVNFCCFVITLVGSSLFD